MSEVLRIICFDLSALFWRYAFGSAGKEMGAPFELTLGQVRKLSDGFGRVVIACDSGRSFRSAIDPKYKSKRPPKSPAHVEQLRRVIERLEADGAHVFRAPKHSGEGEHALYYEADDVIGTVAQWASDAGHDLRIVTGDKDLLQLVDDHAGIEVQSSVTGALMRYQDVIDKCCVPPVRISDWLALAGDASDTYKPYPGVAEGTARDWMIEFGDPSSGEPSLIWASAAAVVDRLLERHEDGIPVVKGAKADAVRALGLDPALRGLELATIVRSVPIDCSVLSERRAPAQLVEAVSYGQATGPLVSTTAEEQSPQAPPARHAPVQGPSRALARVDLDPLAIQPHSLAEVEDFARCAFNSRCYTQFINVEQVMMCVLEARERKVPMGVALRSAYIVNGKLAWSASFLAALVINSGKADIFEIVESDTDHAVLAYKRGGRPERTFEVTLEEAVAAGWVKSGSKWASNPRTMLRWFSIREAARAFFPDVVSGMYTPDELRDGVVFDGESEDAA